MRSLQDSIAAIATSVGESGIGVIRVSGSNAIPIVASIFRSAKSVDLNAVTSHTCHFGHLIDSESPSLWKREVGRDLPLSEIPPDPPFSKGGHLIDQVVVTVFRAPQSYTGEDVVEISAHGSPFILDRILQACIQNGARLAEPGEFTQRAFLAGKMDLTQAEAVADLIRAKTDHSHAAALAQLEGHLARQVRDLRNQLVPLLAHIEVGLDHSDEEHDFLSRRNLTQKCEAVKAGIDAILSSSQVGKILREGLRVALVGRPNVGKSSLLNALLKEERAIVTPIPGTTRDTLEEQVNWEGIPVVLTDTAGIRDVGADSVESLGIERTRQALQQADIVLCVFDGSEPFSIEDQRLLQECMHRPHLWVVNKSDLAAQWPAEKLHTLNGGSPVFAVSAKTGTGLTDLVQAVKQYSLGDSGAQEARWILNVRHQTALQRAHAALTEAVAAAQKDRYEECVALELRTALSSLGEIIGETTTDDLLGEIFANFCVGK